MIALVAVRLPDPGLVNNVLRKWCPDTRKSGRYGEDHGQMGYNGPNARPGGTGRPGGLPRRQGQARQPVQECRKAASLAEMSARNIGCKSMDGEYLLAGTSRPSASAIART
jgi:hypothetical protein